MNKLYNKDKDKFIVYNRYKSNKKNAPYVVFLHGLISSMNSTKALHIANYCQQKDYNFISFDNFGCGNSAGKYLNETIGSWLLGVEMVLSNLAPSPVVIVGSSVGGWLALLIALKLPTKLCGLVCLAAAVDFTEEVIWQKLPPSKQQQMEQEGWLPIGGTDCKEQYPISYNLITEARNHLLLNHADINIKCPVHLVHGMLDNDVPYNVSTRLLEKITSENMVLKLIKDAGHNLTRESDLRIITNSIDEIIACR